MRQQPLRALFGGQRLRRARSLILYLDGQRLVAEDFLARRRFEINQDAASVLQRFDRWRTPELVLEAFSGYEPGSVLRSIRLLARKGLLVIEGTPAAERQDALRSWAAWDRAGTYFHFGTKNTRFARTRREARAVLARVRRRPMPDIYKEDPPGERIPVAPPTLRMAPDSLGRALLRRRTCREYRREAIPRRHLEAVVALGFGRLGYLDGGPYGTLLHRSAPSAGARHPIECYVIALDVAGLERGTYHYSVKESALVRLGTASRRQVLDFTWGQSWFADAGAVFILTAVFARSHWKYLTPRAYRTVLLDAAHACQNLLLTATSLGLGASCTAALDEEAIDRRLGLDGITEGAIYLAAIGVPDAERVRRAKRLDALVSG